MNTRESRPSEAEAEIKVLPGARCPECGSEEIERTDQPQLPPDRRGRCTACDYRAHTLAFHRCWNWEHMSEDDCKQARRRRERYEDKVAEHQHSATYHAEQREP